MFNHTIANESDDFKKISWELRKPKGISHLDIYANNKLVAWIDGDGVIQFDGEVSTHIPHGIRHFKLDLEQIAGVK